MDPLDLRWKLAVVTGGGGGLGRSIAVRLARASASVLVADRDLAAAEETVRLVHEARSRGWALQVDPTDPVEARLLLDRARDLGGADVLVSTDGEVAVTAGTGGADEPDEPGVATRVVRVRPQQGRPDDEVAAEVVRLLRAGSA